MKSMSLQYLSTKMIIPMSLLILLLKTTSISCEEEEEEEDHSSIIRLTTVDFNNVIGTNNFFVMFYAPWCSYCTKLKPTWEELAEMLNEPESRVKIAKVDCTTESGICKQQQITSYPTLLYYKKGETEPKKYSGIRDLSTLANFLNEQLGSNVAEQDVLRPPGPVELTDETYAEHLAKGRHFVKFYAPWCGHCQNLAPVWESVGVLYAPYETVTVGKLDCTIHKEACRTYEIKSYPTLLWIENGVKIEKYQGPRTVEDIHLYIEEKLLNSAEAPATAEPEKTEKEAPTITHLTQDTFSDEIKQGITFVEFFAPWCGHCKSLAPTWQNLGEQFAANRDVTIADVDCTRAENKPLCDDQEVPGFPTLILYKNGERLERYRGPRSLEDLSAFVNKHSASTEHDEL